MYLETKQGGLTGEISLHGVLLPPDGELVDLQLSFVRDVLVLIPNRLALLLFKVL